MQKWEYCVITGVQIINHNFSGAYPKLSYLSPVGIEKQVDLGNNAASKRPKGMENVSEGGYIAATIAQLGIEGWEMVSTVNESSTATSNHCIYFRRPIE